MATMVRLVLNLFYLVSFAGAFSTKVPPTSTSVTHASTYLSRSINKDIFETLKWEGSTPSFDVVQRTQEYVDSFKAGVAPSADWYHKEYVLRGPVIGPITLSDLRSTQGVFDFPTAFPDLTMQQFGFSVDPENPFRCYYLSRWRATHAGPLQLGYTTVPATNNKFESPVWTSSVFWTPEGTIIYEQVGATVDRLEGNSKGKAAIFGLLHSAGVELPGTPGDTYLQLVQNAGHAFGLGGRSFSKEEDIPKWWTDPTRGASV